MHEFNARMDQLRAEYRALAAADLQKLREQAAALQGDEQDRPALAHMAQVLHRIAGGAGVFGFARLSEQARGLELDLGDWLDTALGARYRAALPELREHLGRLDLE